MAIYVNGTEVEIVNRNGAELDEVYCNGGLVWESTILIARPTVSGAFTFDTASHSATISGYNASTMSISGTQTATAAGTYTITFTPLEGYAWSDTETTEAYSLTWSIAKRTLTAPTLTGTTSFAFVQGVTHTVSDSGFNATYMSRGGTWSYTDSSFGSTITNTVTWSLLYPSSTTWGDGTTAAKSATWTIGWVYGTSHYSNDIYNSGWYSGSLVFNPNGSYTFGADSITVNYNGSGADFLYSVSTSNTFHVQCYVAKSVARLYETNDTSTFTGTRWDDGTGYTSTLNAWVEIYGARKSTRPYIGAAVGQTINGANGSKIGRIWIT